MKNDNHSAHHSTTGASTLRVRVAFLLNFVFTIIELIGGLWTNSTAILADALHDLGDTFSLGLSWYFSKVSERGRTNKFSYGYKRFSLLAAFVNSMVLLVGSMFILTQAVPRLLSPEHSNAPGMIVLAVVGIAMNGLAVLKLRAGKTLNERVTTWHLMEDMLGWIAVLIAGVFIAFYDLHVIDPILSILITLYVLRNVLKNLKETVLTFLQEVPSSIDLGEIEKCIANVPGVIRVHDTHVWSLDGEYSVFTSHVMLAKETPAEEMFKQKCCILDLVKANGINHITIEMEREGETCHGMVCATDSEEKL